MMIKVLYSPQVNNIDKLVYEFNGEVLNIHLNDQTDTFDFSECPEGRVDNIEHDFPIDNIIEDAYRENGILHLKLLSMIGHDATYEECFPDWIEV
jgi:hypothetical protein